jgi:NAD(P)-dependent dehydrogenase (short-subunit alcohol dehydrogenase family)
MAKVVLVTGCRSGIGLSIAVESARAGHIVYAGLRDSATHDDLLREAAGLSIVPLQLDVTRADHRKEAVERVISEQGRLDVLVNNAGIALGGFLEQVDEDELRRVYDVNVFGTWAMTCAALPAMRAAHSGLIIMISSLAGRMAMPGLGAYASSKFALEAIGEAFRHELALFGVDVVLIEPGAYRTDIFARNRTLARRALDPDDAYAPYAQRLEGLVTRLVDRVGRDPVEVARLAVSLFEARRPALRHPIGPGAWLRTLLLRFAPFTLFELLFRRALGPRSSPP